MAQLVTACGGALAHASPRLQADHDIVRAAVRNDPSALQHAALELRSCEALVAELPADCMRFAADSVRYSRSTVLQQVRNEEFMGFHRAPQQLRRNKALVWEAVQINWGAFACAHRDLRGDADFARRCVAVHGGCFAHVSRKLQRCRSLALLALQTDGYMLAYCDAKLCNDPELVRAAVKASPGAFEYASQRLRSRRDIVLHCVWHGSNRHHALAHANDPCVLLYAALCYVLSWCLWFWVF